MLYLIGIGLNDEKDITVKGLELVKKADVVYLENYTSSLNCSINDLEKFYGKKIVIAERELVENNSDKLLKEAKEKNVALLIIGDVFAATTHIGLLIDAQAKKVKVEIVHNASILNAIGETGLFLYQFGKITSIPFECSNVKVPIDVFNNNYKLGYHTLFLLDLKPKENKFMSVNEAAKYLIKNGIVGSLLAVGCARLGGKDQEIRVGSLKEMTTIKLSKFPQCLIIPGELHFVEEDSLRRFK